MRRVVALFTAQAHGERNHEMDRDRAPGLPTLSLVTLCVAALGVASLVTLAGCGGSSGCPSFKAGVQAWTAGPGYKGAVARVMDDEAMTETTRRIELMSLAGLQCTFDEDQKVSTADKQSSACKCARPTDPEAATADCDSWAKSAR